MTKTHSYDSLKKASSEAWSAVMATAEWQVLREYSIKRELARKELRFLEKNRIAVLALLAATPERKHFDVVNRELNDNPEYSAYIQSVMEAQDDA